MLAKNLMAAGKLCLILVVSSNCYAQSWTRPLFQDWTPDSGIVGMLYNAAQYHTTKLNGRDQDYHTQAVYHALNNAENGELVEWFSDRSDSMGKVQIAMTWSSNGDICRRLHHYVRSGSRDRAWGETACTQGNTNRWVFTDK